MFTLYFFHANDMMVPLRIANGTAEFLEDYIREDEFFSFAAAVDRMSNIGSRWVHFTNACIIDDQGEVVGTYMADGFNVVHEDYVHA
jgi:hypothetical protein